MNKEITWKSYNYCRKSTDVDDKQQNSLDHQIESCKRTAKKYWLEIYKETIESKSAMIGFTSLINNIEQTAAPLTKLPSTLISAISKILNVIYTPRAKIPHKTPWLSAPCNANEIVLI